MSNTNLLYHVVLRTKNSMPAISQKHEVLLYSHIWNILKLKKCYLYRIGGMPDHVHILLYVPPTIAISNLIHDLKLSTNRYLSTEKDKYPLFCGWGREYFASTLAESELPVVKDYIKHQKEHHKVMNFRQELLQWAKERGIMVNEKYLLID